MSSQLEPLLFWLAGKRNRIMNQPSEIEKAWFAGFLDGEGYIGIVLQSPHKNRPRESPIYRLFVEIDSTYLPALERVRAIWGVGNIKPYYRRNQNPKWNPAWRWQVGANLASSILDSVLPYLCVKRRQAEVAIAFQSRKRKRTQDYRGGRNKHIPSCEFEKDKGESRAIQNLNKRFTQDIAQILENSNI